MQKPKLTYFDAPASRGEECRIALHVAGIAFEDNRIAREAWAALKPTTPFGSLPVLELPDRPPLAHSIAILVYIGRSHGLHPQDPFEAAQHEALMCHVEDMRAQITPTLRMTDEAQKQQARAELAANYLPAWGQYAERQLKQGPFVAGAKLQVADIKLYMAVRWIASGSLDHVRADVFAACPKLLRLYEAVGQEPRVRAWVSKYSP